MSTCGQSPSELKREVVLYDSSTALLSSVETLGRYCIHPYECLTCTQYKLVLLSLSQEDSACDHKINSYLKKTDGYLCKTARPY